jgi:hypothetical protein
MKVLSLLALLIARLILGDARAQVNPGIIHFPNRERARNRIPSVAVASRKTVHGSHWSWRRSSFGTTPLSRSARRGRVQAYRELLKNCPELDLIPHRTGSACLTQLIRILSRRRGADLTTKLIATLLPAGYEAQGSYVPIHLSSSFSHCVWADLVELSCEPSVSLTISNESPRSCNPKFATEDHDQLSF